MDLDFNFINRAQRVTSFNLTSSDFTSLKYKKEIQFLFNSHFFPKFDLSKTINEVDMQKFNSLTSSLKAENKGDFVNLHNYHKKLTGFGPGEITLFFLIDNAVLGGGSSAGVDVIVGAKKYEVKGIVLNKDGFATDLKLGGTVPLAKISVALNNLRKNLGLAGTETEMAGSIIDTMRQKAPVEFKAIEQEYATIAYNNYFKNHEIIFIDNKAGNNIGNILAVKKVLQKDIFIERATSNTIKPKVKI